MHRLQVNNRHLLQSYEMTKRRTDYDEWERNGAEGWSYNDLRPADTKIRVDEHGTSGPWQIKGLDHGVRHTLLYNGTSI
ncbi:hypothetical protein Clacol_005069 [Clathrus columnatus]|uniref:Uncharacterized protein n=1 Tax=Clathrus columnatus TaxID=1419009 RepID=A0AAV5ACV3_9AGAM|nr:hypothetical protein Clacol_005069 [Clathrus columnatus]